MKTDRTRNKPRHARRAPARIGRPPGSTREETIARLLVAARVQFGARGYAGASLTDIAREAGITHSSVYRYFASKQELYLAAFEAAQAELLPEYLEAMTSSPTLKGKVAAVFRASARVDAADPSVGLFLAASPIEFRRHPELLELLEINESPIMAALHEVFEDARRRGEIPAAADDEGLLIAFMGSALGISLLTYGLQRGDMGAAYEILLQAIDGGFFRP